MAGLDKRILMVLDAAHLDAYDRIVERYRTDPHYTDKAQTRSTVFREIVRAIDESHLRKQELRNAIWEIEEIEVRRLLNEILQNDVLGEKELYQFKNLVFEAAEREKKLGFKKVPVEETLPYEVD